MWPEWKSLVARWKVLRTMMIKKEKSADAIQLRPWKRTAGRQIADIIAVRPMNSYEAFRCGYFREMDRYGIACGEGLVKRLIKARIEGFYVARVFHCGLALRAR